MADDLDLLYEDMISLSESPSQRENEGESLDSFYDDLLTLGGQAPSVEKEPETKMRPVAQGLRGLALGTADTAGLAGEIALSTPEMLRRAITGDYFGLNKGYDIGSFSEDFSQSAGDIIEEAIPSKETDSPVYEKIVRYSTPGGLLSKASKGIPLLKSLFTMNNKIEPVANVVGSSAQALLEGDEDTSIASGVGGMGAGALTSYALGAKGRVQGAVNLAKKAREEGTTLAQDTLAKMKDSKKMEALAQKEAFNRVASTLGGGDVEEGLRLLRELPDEPRGNIPLSERLQSPELAGLEEFTANNSADFLEAREMARESRNIQRLESLKEAFPEEPISGEDLAKGVLDKRRSAQKLASKEYEAIDPTGTTSIKARSILDEVRADAQAKFSKGELSLSPVARGVIDDLENAVTGTMKSGSRYAKETSIADLQKIRARARIASKTAIGREGGEAEAGVMQKVISGIDSTIEDAASRGEGLTPEQASQFFKAKGQYREYAETFKQGLPQKVASQKRLVDSPSLSIKDLVKASKEDAVRMSKALPKEALPATRASLIDEVVKLSTRKGDVVTSPRLLSANLKNVKEKLSPLFEEDHLKAIDKVLSDISSERRLQKIGSLKAEKLEEVGGNKTTVAHLKEIMQSRFGWKYPIQKKVIQVGAKALDNKASSLDDLINEALIKISYDPQVAKTLAKDYSPSDLKKVLQAQDFKSVLSKAMGATLGVIESLGEKTISSVAKRSAPLASALGVDYEPDRSEERAIFQGEAEDRISNLFKSPSPSPTPSPLFSVPSGTSKKKVEEKVKPDEISLRLEEEGITDPVEKAQFMGQLDHESMGFRKLVEMGSGKKYEGRKDLGNIKEGDGERFKGRGYIQLTGRANYKRYGDIVGVDLENNPELAAEPEIALKVAVAYWKDRVSPRVTDFSDTKKVTKLINGGYNGLEDRIKRVKKYQTLA